MKLKAIQTILDGFTITFGFLALWLGCCWVDNLCWRWFAISCAFFFAFGALACGCGLASAVIHAEIERKADEKRMVRRIDRQAREQGQW